MTYALFLIFYESQDKGCVQIMTATGGLILWKINLATTINASTFSIIWAFISSLNVITSWVVLLLAVFYNYELNPDSLTWLLKLY